MNLLLDEIRTPRKQHLGKEFLTLTEYLSLARRMICRFAPLTVRNIMLHDDDAIGYVAHMIMRGDWLYDKSKSVRISTWRGYIAKRCISKFVCMYKRSLKDGPEVVSEIKDGSYPVVERRRPLSLDDEICDDGTLKDMLEFRPEAREYDSRVLDRLLDSLTDSQRDCVVLHYIHGITQADIARRLGISHQGVRQKLGRAMKTLKERACVGI